MWSNYYLHNSSVQLNLTLVLSALCSPLIALLILYNDSVDAVDRHQPSQNNLLTNELGLKYVWGDALVDQHANGPDGNPYPWERAAKVAARQRSPRFFGDGPTESPQLLSPQQTRDILLKAFQAQERGDFLPGTSFMPPSPTAASYRYSENYHNEDNSGSGAFSKDKSSNSNLGQHHGEQTAKQFSRSHRQGRADSTNFSHSNNKSLSFSSASPARQQQIRNSQQQSNKRTSSSSSSSSGNSNNNREKEKEPEGCVPSRLCPSTYNTTAPLYGVSLTSGQPVTIVQKFPDLLQQVVFQVCKTTECEVLQGECVQTYLPYLFLVIPLGPVTLTGQDYVLVESGCVCRPKYARRYDEPPPLPFIQPLQN